MSSAKKQKIVDVFLWYYFQLFVTADKHIFFLFGRFDNKSMTKKLCGSLIIGKGQSGPQWQIGLSPLF